MSLAKIKEKEETQRRREIAHMVSKADFIRAQVDKVLESNAQDAAASEDVIQDNAALTEVSPWLEITRWPRYLHRYLFPEVALLAILVDLKSKPLLVEFSKSLS